MRWLGLSFGGSVSFIPESQLPSFEQEAGAAPVQADSATADSNEAEGQDASKPADGSDAEETRADANEPDRSRRAERVARRTASEEASAEGSAQESKVAEPNEPNEPGEQLEAVNLKDVEMKQIIDKIASWTGKTVIPHEEAMKQKITIYAPEKLPRAKALEKIYSALRMKNFIAEEDDDTIYLKPIADAKLGMVPTVGADEPLAVFENKDKIVRRSSG